MASRFPQWYSQLRDFFALDQGADAVVARARYGLRRSVAGRDNLPPDRVYEFIRTMAEEAGIPMPAQPPAPGRFVDPNTRQMIDVPSTLQELVVYMGQLEEGFDARMDDILEYQNEQQEAEDEGNQEPMQVQNMDDDDDYGPPVMDDGGIEPPVMDHGGVDPGGNDGGLIEYPIAIAYTYANWGDNSSVMMLPGTYALDDEMRDALGPNSTLDSVGRINLVFGTLGLVDPDTIKPDGDSGTYVVDAWIPADPLQPGASRPASAVNAAVGQTAIPLAGTLAGSGTATGGGNVVQGVSPPTNLSEFHEQLGFRDPSTRLSYDSNAVRVDHPGVRYAARLVQSGSAPSAMDYGCPWLRANYVANCCWFTAIIELVNTTMRRKVLTYDRLWRIAGKPGAFDPAEARLGLSIGDVEPIFEYYDRTVTVLDGENRVVYQRTRSADRKKNHIRPEVWSFLMTEHHVVCLNENDLFRPNIDSKRLTFGAKGGTYSEVTINHPYEVVSPEFPVAEIKKPKALESYDSKSKQRTIKGFATRERRATSVIKLFDPDLDSRSSDDDEKVTLHEAMFSTRYDGTHLSVICTKSMIISIVMAMVTKYRYKPQIGVDQSGDVCICMIVSLDNRASLAFRCLLPGHAPIENEANFESVAEVMQYMRLRHTMVSKLLRSENQSYMHESVADVCHTYSRGGFFHMFDDVSSLNTTFNSCDMNRLYPSTLQVDELPRVDLFNRFELVPSTSDYDRLMPHDLVLVSINDSASIYMDAPINLCFKKNLDKFLDRPTVQLCEPSACHTMLERPTGCTLVTVHAVLCTHMGPSTVKSAIAGAWQDCTLSRFLRKFVINCAIGMLGKRHNNSSGGTSSFTQCFCNREEASLHAEETGERIISVQDELYFALPNVDKVPRLQGGYLMHLWVLDHARWAMQDAYDKLTSAGVNVIGIMCDELYYPSSQQPLVDQFIYDGDSESLGAFGQLKLHAQNVHADSLPRKRNFNMTQYITPSSYDLNLIDELAVPMNSGCVVPVDPEPDEYNITNLFDHTRLLVKASVPGAGKSHAVLSRCAENCVVVCPTNSLCVEFTKRYPGCSALTLHRFLRLRAEEHANDQSYHSAGSAAQHVECDKVLLLDEIYMYPQSLINKLYVRLSVTQATHVYATGDPNQLPPVEDDMLEKLRLARSSNKENDMIDDPMWDPSEGAMVDPTNVSLHHRRTKSIDHLFPKQMTLKKCKRATHAEDNQRMEHICKQLKDPFAELGAVDLVKRNFLNVTFHNAVAMLKADPDQHIAVCYYNATCNAVAKLVHPEGLLQPGVKLVNRRRYAGKGGVVLHVNYEYIVDSVTETHVILKDDDDNLVAVPTAHAEKHMMWWRTRTCHSLQGTSVSGSVIIFDLMCPHMSKEFIYVALTRARNLGTVCYVEE